MPVLVRNTAAGPTVFSDLTKNLMLEWWGAGDPQGRDVQYVPDELVTSNIEFMRNVRKGIFQIESAPESVSQLLALQDTSFQAQEQSKAAAVAAAMDPAAKNDLIQVPCVGPAGRGQGTCGEQVLVREKSKDDAPALCAKHKDLAPQYVQIETDKMVDGKAVVGWTRATMSAPEQ